MQEYGQGVIGGGAASGPGWGDMYGSASTGANAGGTRFS
jgi:hypothetical protein